MSRKTPYDHDSDHPSVREQDFPPHPGRYEYENLDLRPDVNNIESLGVWIRWTFKAYSCVYRIKLAYWIIPKK